MRDSSGNNVVLSAIALIAILLAVVVGAGFYFASERRQAELLARAEMARAEEARARAIAKETHAEALQQRMVADQARAIQAEEIKRLQEDAQALSPNEQKSIRTAVESVFRTQEEAWNRGDIEAFMEHYWKSDDLTFSSGGKTTRGWDATLARYRERYPTREQMGRLMLSDLEITPLGNSAALVLGQWKLDREPDPVGGNYSIILRKLNNRWLIIHDHTSRLSE